MADLKIPPAPESLTNKFMTAMILAVVVSGLYFGRPVLMPLALAVLMSFALAPLVSQLKRFKLGNVPAVIVSLVLAVVVVSSLGLFMGSQLAKLAAELPHYQTNLAQKIHSVVGGAAHNDTINRLNKTIENLAEQFNGGNRAEDATGTEPTRSSPFRWWCSASRRDPGR